MKIEAKHLRAAAERVGAGIGDGCCVALTRVLRDCGYVARGIHARDILEPFKPPIYDAYWWFDEDGRYDFSPRALAERQLFLLFLAAAWDDIK